MRVKTFKNSYFEIFRKKKFHFLLSSKSLQKSQIRVKTTNFPCILRYFEKKIFYHFLLSSKSLLLVQYVSKPSKIHVFWDFTKKIFTFYLKWPNTSQNLRKYMFFEIYRKKKFHFLISSKSLFLVQYVSKPSKIHVFWDISKKKFPLLYKL